MHDLPEHIDRLMSRLGAAYRAMPRNDNLAQRFREALSHAGVPGGYARRGRRARPLAESLNREGADA